MRGIEADTIIIFRWSVTAIPHQKPAIFMPQDFCQHRSVEWDKSSRMNRGGMNRRMLRKGLLPHPLWMSVAQNKNKLTPALQNENQYVNEPNNLSPSCSLKSWNYRDNTYKPSQIGQYGLKSPNIITLKQRKCTYAGPKWWMVLVQL